MSAVLEAPVRGVFEVHLGVYDGPFDLLLGLIGKHKLDVTEVALATVTDEFVAHVRAAGFDLERATTFLVVAATLLDMKAARLLPGLDGDDEEALALLEARDLLFARLLQHQAFQQVARWLGAELVAGAGRLPRVVTLPTAYRDAVVTTALRVEPAGLAAAAAAALAPGLPQLVDLDHVHAPRVSVREAIVAITERLHAVGSSSFRALCEDCSAMVEVVARFLALLELFRDGRVHFDQVAPLGELRISWRPEVGGEADVGQPGGRLPGAAESDDERSGAGQRDGRDGGAAPDPAVTAADAGGT